MRWCVTAVVVLLAVPAAGFAPSQSERYELGRRMRAFDVAWEAATEAGRGRAGEVLPRVNSHFLAGRFNEASRVLDLATHALQTEDAPGATTRWAMSLSAFPETRL